MSDLISKAKRLVLDGHVGEVRSACMYRVSGDHDYYHVVIFKAGAEPTAQGANFCTCPAVGVCSHLLAAQYESERTT